MLINSYVMTTISKCRANVSSVSKTNYHVYHNATLAQYVSELLYEEAPLG